MRGDGQPIRFWGGTTTCSGRPQRRDGRAELAHHARFLAKRA